MERCGNLYLEVRSGIVQSSQKKCSLTLILAICLLVSSLPNAKAYNSHTFEDTEYLNDRPYIAGMAADAYVCVSSANYRTSTSQIVAGNGDKLSAEVKYANPVPVLYEYVGSTWYWVSKDAVVNEKGNPCSAGNDALWFNAVNFAVPKNSSITFFKELVSIYSPDQTITTTRRHHRFLIGDKVTTTTETIQGKRLFTSKLDVYRSDGDARSALVGPESSFLANPDTFQSRDLRYQIWFPCANSNGGC